MRGDVMANESVAQLTSLVSNSGNKSEISVTRIREVDVESVERVDTSKQMAEVRQATAEQAKISREAFDKVVSELEAYVQSSQRNLNFQVDDRSGRVIVQVIDASNDRVIRQIPSEEMVAISQRLQEYLDENQAGYKGMLLEIKA